MADFAGIEVAAADDVSAGNGPGRDSGAYIDEYEIFGILSDAPGLFGPRRAFDIIVNPAGKPVTGRQHFSQVDGLRAAGIDLVPDTRIRVHPADQAHAHRLRRLPGRPADGGEIIVQAAAEHLTGSLLVQKTGNILFASQNIPLGIHLSDQELGPAQVQSQKSLHLKKVLVRYQSLFQG